MPSTSTIDTHLSGKVKDVLHAARFPSEIMEVLLREYRNQGDAGRLTLFAIVVAELSAHVLVDRYRSQDR